MAVTAGRRERSRGELLLHQLHFHLDSKLFPPPQGSIPQHHSTTVPTAQAAHECAPGASLLSLLLGSSEEGRDFIWMRNQRVKQRGSASACNAATSRLQLLTPETPRAGTGPANASLLPKESEETEGNCP